LEQLETAFRFGKEGRYLCPLDEALLDLEAMVLGPEDTHRIVQGAAIRGTSYRQPVGSGLRRAYSSEGDLLAIVDYDADRDCWKPRKVFAVT
jgi:hypothetical protein